MSAEELKAIARRIVEEGFNKGNLAVYDEILAPNFVCHNSVQPNVKDRESYKRVVAAIRRTGRCCQVH